MSLSVQNRISHARMSDDRKPADILLWLLAAFPMLLLAALLAAVIAAAPAAAEGDRCQGRNLLADLKKTDPGRYDDIMRQGEATPNGKGVLWKIEKPGVEPSFLLGTMHVTDPRVVTLPAAVQAAYDQAGTIVIESDEILDEQKMAMSLLARPELTMFTDGTTIASLMSKDDYAQLDEGLKQRGVPALSVARMRPWMILSVVAMPACEMTRKGKGAQFLDQKLAVDALASGKQVKGLETMVEQAEAMSAVPDQSQLKSLMETLKLGKKMDDVVETMTDLYLDGNSGAMVPMMKAMTATVDEDAGYADFEQSIIIDRNKRMTERALPIIDKGNALIAVGFLHLPGDKGLIALLRDKGYTITAVK